MPIELPDAICFRITRRCNADCGFCLAPPDAVQPDGDTLVQRIDWLMSRGVRSFDFCGGEPTIHPELPRLLSHVQDLRGKARITTNGMVLSGHLLSAFRSAGPRVKVSLHGDRDYHNGMVGRDAFDATTANLRRLLAAGVTTSVQSTIVAEGTWVVDWLIDFCIGTGVRRLSIMPFLPRGRGSALRERFGLTAADRALLRHHVVGRRRALNGRLDLRWLDLTSHPIHVVEVDGRILLEGPSETGDRIICRIPAE